MVKIETPKPNSAAPPIVKASIAALRAGAMPTAAMKNTAVKCTTTGL